MKETMEKVLTDETVRKEDAAIEVAVSQTDDALIYWSS